MTNAKTIEMARKMLSAGNGAAYARLISGAIRSAMSDRAANAFRKAVSEDGAERFFDKLDTSCPTAA
ncbi:hypothetical protein J2Y63_002432 [Shinella sp. BE166]|uniref:hypothetical protein n=1 Tax=Shinella sp. BE166 TaxID=3373918 RepID=UPI003EBE5DB2